MGHPKELDYRQFDFDIDKERRTIIVTARGCHDDVMVREFFAQLRSMPQFQDGYNVLVNALEVTGSKVTGRCIYDIAEMTDNDQNLMAIVVREPIAFGLCQIYEICANTLWERVSVFTETESAFAWFSSAEHEGRS